LQIVSISESGIICRPSSSKPTYGVPNRKGTPVSADVSPNVICFCNCFFTAKRPGSADALAGNNCEYRHHSKCFTCIVAPMLVRFICSICRRGRRRSRAASRLFSLMIEFIRSLCDGTSFIENRNFRSTRLWVNIRYIW
jgi:hypothetical protein